MLSSGGYIGPELPYVRAARWTLRLRCIRVGAPPLYRMLLRPLGGRQLRALTSLLALVLAAVVLSGALGAGAALLVAGRGLATDVASVGPSVDVQSSSGGSPTAFRAATSEDRSALAERDGAERSGSGEPTAATRSSRTTASVLEQRGDGSAAGAGQEGVIWGEPSQSEQGGASEPPSGSSPGVPVENEEPSEEGPGEDGESEGSEEGSGEDGESEGSEEGPGEDGESEGSEEGSGEDGETICHNAGSPSAQTITVGAPAVAAHLAHGDTLGACS